MRNRRRSPVLAIAHGPMIPQRSVEELYEAVWYLATAVEALVDDETRFGDLAAPHPHQLVLTVDASVRHVHVADLALAELLDASPVLLDPGQVSQALLAAQGLDEHLA